MKGETFAHLQYNIKWVFSNERLDWDNEPHSQITRIEKNIYIPYIIVYKLTSCISRPLIYGHETNNL